MTEHEGYREHVVRRAADYASLVGHVVMIHERAQGMTWVGRLVGITQTPSHHAFALENGMVVGGDVLTPEEAGGDGGLSIQRVPPDAPRQATPTPAPEPKLPPFGFQHEKHWRDE